ncbi:MAG TPA: GNAT family N-acetyltransferase [Mycobacteriales bacterium]|nr:GNAT family N-acetyltransferase [Mycobacteriales bacterium]
MHSGQPPRAAPAGDGVITLEPLRVDHAEEMAVVLADPRLYTFTGGEPPTVAELRARYRRQSAGRSDDGGQAWLNWIVRRVSDGAALGFVQATVTGPAADRSAEIAWVIGAAHQGLGWACRAAALMVAQLRAAGVPALTAHIHPDNHASAAVAAALGMAATGRIEDGEDRWEG